MRSIEKWGRGSIALAAILGLLPGAPSLGAAAPARNVLLIMADDLNTLLGCYGDPRVKTPHLDRLAARGVRFERAYCTYPLCGPSRNSMLTGLYPNSSGILENAQLFRQTLPAHVPLPQAFRQQGYFAARIGKLYHYGVPSSIGTDGIDDPASWEVAINPAGVDRREDQPRVESLVAGRISATLSWFASAGDDAAHTDGKIATQAEWVIERCAREKDRPFFFAIGFFRPHTPLVAPRRYYDMYPLDEMPIIRAGNSILPAARGGARPEQDAMTDRQRRQVLQAYYACITFIDAQVGRVLGALERHGLAGKPSWSLPAITAITSASMGCGRRPVSSRKARACH